MHRVLQVTPQPLNIKEIKYPIMSGATVLQCVQSRSPCIVPIRNESSDKAYYICIERARPYTCAVHNNTLLISLL